MDSANRRLNTVFSHLLPSGGGQTPSLFWGQEDLALTSSLCIGESSNRQVDDPSKKPKFQRVPLKIVFPDKSSKDERYAGSGDLAIVEGELFVPPTKSKTCIVFMHPSGIQTLLPMPNAMAKLGMHVAACTSRYPNNDTCLIMEKVLIDLGAFVSYLKKVYKYEKIILAGWSGGGSLSSFYQSQAESVSVTHLPSGEPIDLSGLIPADGLLILAAHQSRAQIFTEWLDPAVLDESDPEVRDPSVDLWNPANKPPYTKEFLEKFRKGQWERNLRITLWAKSRLLALEQEPALAPMHKWKLMRKDHPFIVRCTQADPRRLDPTLDPNGRVATTLEELAQENHSPVGLARFTTLKSWLSQWSVTESNADGPAHLARVKCPILVLGNEADHLVPLSHPESMYKAIKHDKKQYVIMQGATHYYFGQNELMTKAIHICHDFLTRYNLIEKDLLLG